MQKSFYFKRHGRAAKKSMKNRKGAAFIIVVVLSAFILLLAGLMAILTQAYYKNQAKNLSVDKALTVAEKGLAALTSASWTYIPDPITKVDERPGAVDNFSFYLTKVEAPVQFSVNGSPDPSEIVPDPANYVTYDLFTVYCIGVITNGPSLTTLGTGATLMTALDHLAATGASGTITVSSERVISSTVVEQETYPGVKAYDSAISYSGDGTETVTYGGKAYICDTAYPLILPTGGILPTDGNYWSPSPLAPTLVFVPNNAKPTEISTNYLPRKSDWQEITLTDFKNVGKDVQAPPPEIFTVNVSGNITIAAGAGGSVAPTATTLIYDVNNPGGTVAITATPAAGYYFVSWEVTVNPSYISITNSGAALTNIAARGLMPPGGVGTVTATFAANVGTITVAAGPNGTVDHPTTTLTYNGAAQTIIATAAAGYHFANWAVTGNAAYVSLADANLAETTLLATSSMPQGGEATVTATFTANVSGTITVAAGDNGTVTPTTTTLTYAGAAVPIIATPTAGHFFVGWTVTGNAAYVSLADANLAATTISATSSLPQGGTATVTATFTTNVSGPITIAAGSGGSVTPISTTLTYAGEAVAISATANDGYHFVAWAGTINATYVSLANANLAATTISATSSLPQDGTATVTATFAANVSAPITIAAGANGSVAPTSTTLTYNGSAVTITATPAVGYSFVSWTVTSNATYVSITDANLAATTISATSSLPQGGTATVTATFTANVSGTITIAAGTGGTVAPLTTTLTYAAGRVTITATANGGYHFVSWAVTSNAAYVNIANTNAASTTISATSSMPQGGTATVTATFEGNVSGTITIVAGTGGSVAPTATTLTYAGSAITITATPTAGCTFVGWTTTSNVSYISIANSGAAVTTISATSSLPQSGTATVTATFAGNVSGPITIAAGANGRVTPTSTTLTYAGVGTAITATPSTGYHFVSWAGSVNPSYLNISNTSTAGTTISATSNMPQDGVATVTATFAINTYTISASAGSNGTITPSGGTPKNYGATQAYVITPATGYYIAFVLVDGNAVAVTSPYTFTAIAADHTISVSFAINTYTIAVIAGTNDIGSNGTVTPVGVTIKNFWESQTYTITPNIGYHIASLTVDGNAVTVAATYTFANVTINHTIGATFAAGVSGPITIAAVANGSVAPTSTTLTYMGTPAAITATANTGYYFVSWAVTVNPSYVSITNAGATATTIAATSSLPQGGTATVTATFAAYWTHTGAVLTGYTGPGGAETMPGIMDGVTITSIGASAFATTQGRLLTSVTIPSSVTSIGDNAFELCPVLTRVTIPGSVTSIGAYAFSNCTALASVTIPTSVTSIGVMAFMNCTGFTSSLTIPGSVTSIGRSAFADCTGLTNVTILGNFASGGQVFSSCTGLTSVTIGNSVTTIGLADFFYCLSLTNVTIPASVTSLGDQAFRDCRGLATAYFLGNAPTGTTWVFNECALGFTVHYISGKTGWTNLWYGFTTVTP